MSAAEAAATAEEASGRELVEAPLDPRVNEFILALSDKLESLQMRLRERKAAVAAENKGKYCPMAS